MRQRLGGTQCVRSSMNYQSKTDNRRTAYERYCNRGNELYHETQEYPNKTIDVRHSVVLSEKSRREIEDEIVEKLYKIFTKK